MKLRIIAIFGASALLLALVGCSGGNKNANQANRNLADANAPVPAGENPTTAPGSVPTGPDPTQGVTPKPLTTPGGDNSTITNEMDSQTGSVTSTRVFNNNKNLSKVVVLTDTRNGKLTRTVTAYDLAGKPHTLPESQADSVMSQSGDDVARAAGLKVAKSDNPATDARDVAGRAAGKSGNVVRSAADQASEQLNKVKVPAP